MTIFDLAKQIYQQLVSYVQIQPLYYTLIQQSQPQKIIQTLTELILNKVYIEGSMEIGFKQSEDLMNFKFSFNQNQKGYLRASLEFVDEFLKTCVDQVVQELIVEITTLVFDYSE